MCPPAVISAFPLLLFPASHTNREDRAYRSRAGRRIPPPPSDGRYAEARPLIELTGQAAYSADTGEIIPSIRTYNHSLVSFL